MSPVPFFGQARKAVIDFLSGDPIPDWCNRCGRQFTVYNHGWLRPLTPDGGPDKLGRLMYESVCRECAMPRLTLVP